MAAKQRTKANTKASKTRADILVAGGGYVGLCVAVSIKASAPHLDVHVVDPAPEEALHNDERASAIAQAAKNMLDQLGIWHELGPTSQPINEMIVTDSKVADVARPVFLTFANEGNVAENGAEEPFAYMVENRLMVGALRRRAAELGVVRVQDESATGFEISDAGVNIELASGNQVSARLLVAADGVRSKLRDLAGIKTVHWPYDQKGIVCTVEHERPHEGRAEEHFLPAGPFAILPLRGNRSSLVWTESSKDADRLLAMNPALFELELEQRFGRKLGEISVAGKVQAFPLGLRLARDYVKPRFALVGDAAHGVHPIAGQGLNLGFKDAAALAECLVDADRLGLDIGGLDVLENYQRWRRFDTVQMGVVTDVLNRLFSNDNDVLRAVRDFGLGMVERMPGLKRQFIDRASARSGLQPKLLKGEAI